MLQEEYCEYHTGIWKHRDAPYILMSRLSCGAGAPFLRGGRYGWWWNVGPLRGGGGTHGGGRGSDLEGGPAVILRSTLCVPPEGNSPGQVHYVDDGGVLRTETRVQTVSNRSEEPGGTE